MAISLFLERRLRRRTNILRQPLARTLHYVDELTYRSGTLPAAEPERDLEPAVCCRPFHTQVCWHEAPQSYRRAFLHAHFTHSAQSDPRNVGLQAYFQCVYISDYISCAFELCRGIRPADCPGRTMSALPPKTVPRIVMIWAPWSGPSRFRRPVFQSDVRFIRRTGISRLEIYHQAFSHKGRHCWPPRFFSSRRRMGSSTRIV